MLCGVLVYTTPGSSHVNGAHSTGQPTNVEFWRVLARLGASESEGGPSKLLIQHVTIIRHSYEPEGREFESL